MPAEYDSTIRARHERSAHFEPPGSRERLRQRRLVQLGGIGNPAWGRLLHSVSRRQQPPQASHRSSVNRRLMTMRADLLLDQSDHDRELAFLRAKPRVPSMGSAIQSRSPLRRRPS